MSTTTGNKSKFTLRIDAYLHNRVKRLQAEKHVKGGIENLNEVYEEVVEHGLREVEAKYGINSDFRVRQAV